MIHIGVGRWQWIGSEIMDFEIEQTPDQERRYRVRWREMDIRKMTLEQIRQAGLEALVRELGPAGAVRFLQQFETGHGDYSTERHTWLGKQDVRTLAEKIRQQRKDQ